MSILAQIQEAYGTERQIATISGAGSDGGDLLLYYTPVSMFDIDRAKRKNSDMGSGEFMAEIVIAKCQLENGDRAFTLEDKIGLQKLPMSGLLRLFNQIFAASSVEDHVKN